MDYDWTNEENASKWRGLFVGPLQKVLIQVHPQFTAKEDALEYVENLLLRLLAMLTAKPAPMSVADVEVRKTWDFVTIREIIVSRGMESNLLVF
jgi:son of sevenless-like protein